MIGNEKRKCMELQELWHIPNYTFTLREWQSKRYNIIKEELIVQASDITGGDGWQSFPIGMQYNFAAYGEALFSNKLLPRDEMVLCAILDTTDQSRRSNCLVNRSNILATTSIGNTNQKLKPEYYFKDLPKYKFVVSPEGNGIDCHRHYEALLAGCIPIVEHNDLIKQKYVGCPILYTTDFAEINDEYLTNKYNEMLDKSFNFSCLFLSYYSPETQHKIKMCGNYWMKRLTDDIWYNI